MSKKRVAVLAATGMVGQRYVSILSGHPGFEVVAVTGNESVGRRYGAAVRSREGLAFSREVAALEVLPTKPSAVDADLVFSPLPTDAAAEVEPAFASKGFKVVSDASPHRMDPDVPLLIPEVNPGHLQLLGPQRKGRGWKGFLATTPNCTAVGLTMIMKPLHDAFRVTRVVVSTMQAVSGAGYPGVPSLDIIDYVVPYIKGEEEKVETEPLKMLGQVRGGRVQDEKVQISAMCHRGATTDGHLESAYIETESRADPAEVKRVLREFRGEPQELSLPSAPSEPIIVREEPDRPQVKVDRYAGSVPGMSVVVGRVRRGPGPNSVRLSFVSHNTIRGAAGSTILLAELMDKKGLLG